MPRNLGAYPCKVGYRRHGARASFESVMNTKRLSADKLISFLKPVLDLEGTGKKLKSLMNAKGITPRRVQTACGFPRVQSVYNWFNGRNLPTLDNLVVLARVLGVKVDDIIVTRDVEV